MGEHHQVPWHASRAAREARAGEGATHSKVSHPAAATPWLKQPLRRLHPASPAETPKAIPLPTATMTWPEFLRQWVQHPRLQRLLARLLSPRPRRGGRGGSASRRVTPRLQRPREGKGVPHGQLQQGRASRAVPQGAKAALREDATGHSHCRGVPPHSRDRQGTRQQRAWRWDGARGRKGGGSVTAGRKPPPTHLQQGRGGPKTSWANGRGVAALRGGGRSSIKAGEANDEAWQG